MTGKANKGEVLSELVNKYLLMCGNCAQTSFIALQESFDLEDGGILKALTPLPGIALRGETCGAVIGSLMALGLVYGRDREQLDDWSSYIRSLPSARRFCRSFEAEYGSTMCGDIVEAEFGKRFIILPNPMYGEWEKTIYGGTRKIDPKRKQELRIETLKKTE